MLLIVCFTAAGVLAAQSDNIHRLTLIDGPAVDANNQVHLAMTDAQNGLNAYQISGNRELLQPYFGTHDRTMAALAMLQDKLALGAVDEADRASHTALGDRQRQTAEQWWANALLVEQAVSRGEPSDVSQNRTLFSRFSVANTELDRYLTTERDQTRLSARTMSGRGEAVSIAATLAALLAMLVLGRQVAGAISRPLTELRDTMVRQREGEPDARAREDQGSLELRSVAHDFNELTEQNLALLQVQARDLGTHEVTLAIARAIRATSNTQQALDVMCVAMGEGLGADRVVAKTIGVRHEVQLCAQWRRSNLRPLRDLSLLPELGGLAEESWLSMGFRARDDILAAEALPRGLDRYFHQVIGARAAIMVPIGLDDRVIGMIYVFMVSEPRSWTTAETNVVQAVGGFVARAVVAAEQLENQHEYVDRIERLDRQKSDFLATVSHELRTPLTSISGYVEVLQEQETGELSVRQHRMLEVISRNTIRLRTLIEDVMAVSRIEGGVSKANFVEVSVSGLITRAGEELSVLAQNRGIELEIDVGPREAFVLGDQVSLDRALVNVLSNAIKFSRPGGAVTLGGTLDQGAHRVLITCQDHGVGIPAQDLVNLFTRFFRASNATDQSIPGTGLGLSIAKQIVQDHHGGELRLTSVEGEGTTVVIELPLREPLPELSRALGAVENDTAGNGTVGNGSESDDVFRIRV
jgi:two-component system, OmpR family, phosphate regulon sensor histidine kinase PhoR